MFVCTHLDCDGLAGPLALVNSTEATDSDLAAVLDTEGFRSFPEVAVAVGLALGEPLMLALQALELLQPHAQLRRHAQD